MDFRTIIEALRADAVAVCAGLVAGADVVAFSGPAGRLAGTSGLVSTLASLDVRGPLGAAAGRWLVEAGGETLAAQPLDDGRVLYVVFDARSTPGLARVRLLQAAARLGMHENP